MLLNHLAKHWPHVTFSIVIFVLSVSLISGMPYWADDKEAETLRIGYVCSHSWSKPTWLNGCCSIVYILLVYMMSILDDNGYKNAPNNMQFVFYF